MKRLLLAVLILMLISEVYGHPGRTNSEGCHTCKTSCEQYGLQYGEYHCHNKISTSVMIESTINSSSSSVKTSSTTSTKKTTSTVKVTEIITANVASSSTIESAGDNVVNAEDEISDYKIEKDIYPKTSINQVAYESSDYKARRAALYMFSFILILVLIKFIVRK